MSAGPAPVSVALCQWLARPGRPVENLAVAAEMIGLAARGGAEVVVLPELWASGYDRVTLADDATAAAEPLPGPRCVALAELARRHRVLLFAGSVPEAAAGAIYNTAVVFTPQDGLVAAHRKAHLYPLTGEGEVFAPGDCLNVFDTGRLGRVGLTVCFDGDFPEVGGALARRGARTVVQPCAYEAEAASWWDVVYPAVALANGQWWLLANQCGTTATGTFLGASRVLDPGGRVVAEARRVPPGGQAEPEIVHAEVDLGARPAAEIAGVTALRSARRPELYAEHGADRVGRDASLVGRHASQAAVGRGSS